MSASDAILIGEDWISEHYFTTDATSQSFKAQTLARRKVWDEQKDTGSVRSRFTAARGSLLSRMASLDDDPELVGEIRKDLIDVLGYNALGFTSMVSGPVTLVRQVSLTDGPGVALIAAAPAETADDLMEKDVATLAEPYDVDDSTQIQSVSRLLSALFIRDDAPDFALVLAGRIALVAERERWPEGRYLAVDLQLVSERSDDKKGGETDTVLACVSAESLAPDAEGNIWWHKVLEESIKHTVGVSQDLREGVRLSIEIIANDVVTRRAARGLPPLPEGDAQPLAKQSLRFLYRILFLLYAEASPELAVLPTGAPEYEQGYSLDRLRDLIQTPLTSPRAEAGSHLYESLSVLFKLVDRGYAPTEAEEDEGLLQALTFRSLKADLFRPEATGLIDEVKLSNVELQRVLQYLLLSKEKRGSDRGFISYAELGINQLGAVYEGLMSYTGRFAETDLYEVAKGGDGSKGSWLVPVDRAGGIDDKDFVRYEDPITSESKPVLHRTGSFVFRLAGRERQQSASYYTPEVLTRFTVSQALEELLDQDDPPTAAADILAMTVCEPALGSGAFAIEAVRQLAAEYLTRRQDELGERIDPEEYPKELQKVKAYLALHNVYGVDLNSTAVELAEISLWLDTMMEGLQAPWFGLHLRRGNSLIGVRHAVYPRHQVEKKRAWLKAVPNDVPLTQLPDDVAGGRDGEASGGVHHFLLPAEGWGSAINAKEAKELAPEALEKLKQWRKQTLVQPTKAQVDTLVGLGRRVESLWQLTWRRLSIAESEVRRSIDVWGANDLPVGGAVTREQIEESLANPNGAYRRLRRVMDAWCAMWFWPLTEETAPPSFDEWIETLQKLLGRVGNLKKQHADQLSLATAANWEDLGVAEESDLGFAMVNDVQKVIEEHPWLAAAERVAVRQGFFHWELDFAPVFARGGFDLQVGNPPWVRPDVNIDELLAEGDPWWQLKAKSTQVEDAEHAATVLSRPGMRTFVLDSISETLAARAALSSAQGYPLQVGLRADLYRCFMELTWRNAKPTGSCAAPAQNDCPMDNTNIISAAWANEIESWRIAMRAMRLSPQTIELRIYHLRRLARAQVGESPWDVSRADLLEWTGKHEWRRETARAVRSSLRRFWAWGLSTSRTADNVADVLPMIRPEQPQPRPAAPSIVVTAMKDADSRVGLMLRLANELGMRRGEVAQVHPENDLVQDLVGWALVVHGKGSRKRVLPLPDDLATVLRSAPTGYLFPSPAGGHLSPHWVGTLVSRALADGTTMHQLRHLCATEVHEQTRDLRLVQTLLGHASLATTQRYVAVDDSKMRDAIRDRSGRWGSA